MNKIDSLALAACRLVNTPEKMADFLRGIYTDARAHEREAMAHDHALGNTHVLMFVRGWQGGTLSQIAEELGVTGSDILDADGTRMGELARIAQRKLRDEEGRRADKLEEAMKGATVIANHASGIIKELEAKNAALREAMEEILCQHDGNQSPAMNMPDLDYARFVIRQIHNTARAALKAS